MINKAHLNQQKYQRLWSEAGQGERAMLYYNACEKKDPLCQKNNTGEQHTVVILVYWNLKFENVTVKWNKILT